MDGSKTGPLSITNAQSLLQLMAIESVMPPNHLILCCPLLLLPSVLPSIRVFSNEFSSVHTLSRVWLFVTPWTAARQASLSISNSEFTQTYVHGVGDAIQPPHPLSSPSPPAFNLSQDQGLSQWVSSFTPDGQSIGASASAWVLSMKNQGWFLLELTDLISLESKELSRVFSSNTVWKHQFFGAQPFFLVQPLYP